MMLISLYTDIVLFFFSLVSKTSASSRAERVRPLLPSCAGSQLIPRSLYFITCTRWTLKNRGSVKRLILTGHFHDEDIGLQLPKFSSLLLS